MLTRIVEALPKRRREVIAGKYIIQYVFGACACASTELLINKIHVGPACTLGKPKHIAIVF
jgi:hypothetical protein